MSTYPIKCTECDHITRPANIVDLINHHTDNSFGEDGGMLVCEICGGHGHIFKSGKLQEPGKTYERYIKGVVRFPTSEEAYFPYLLLNADTETGVVGHVHFNYYKDTRKPEGGGKLKHGHGPGGAPVLGRDTMLKVIDRLARCGILTANDLEQAAKAIERK